MRIGLAAAELFDLGIGPILSLPLMNDRRGVESSTGSSAAGLEAVSLFGHDMQQNRPFAAF